MKERPIIFSGPMVRAILKGRKTQTRRVVKPQPDRNCKKVIYDPACGWKFHLGYILKCPYGQPGDHLYVRESFTYGTGPVDDSESTLDNSIILYRATWGEPDLRGCWKPSIHMPKWAARLWLEVTDIRVERVQEISEKDAIAEGISIPKPTYNNPDDYKPMAPSDVLAELWDSINGKRPGCAWDDNPWVWVVEFKRIEE